MENLKTSVYSLYFKLKKRNSPKAKWHIGKKAIYASALVNVDKINLEICLKSCLKTIGSKNPLICSTETLTQESTFIIKLNSYILEGKR